MKRLLMLALLDTRYYFGRVVIFFLELKFDLYYILKNRRLPRRLSKEQFKELERLLKERMEEDRKDRQGGK